MSEMNNKALSSFSYLARSLVSKYTFSSQEEAEESCTWHCTSAKGKDYDKNNHILLAYNGH